MSAPAVLPGPFLKRSLKSSIMETGRITFNFTQSSYAFADIYSKRCSDIFQYLVIIVKQIIFAQKIILAVRFEIVVRYIIINQTGITAIVFLNLIIQPNREIFFLSVKEGKTTVNIVQRIVSFFKKAFFLIKRRFLEAVDRSLMNNMT